MIPARKTNSAFSLVEVAISLAIVAFAFVPLGGLLATGLNVFRQSTDTSVGAQIAQRIVNEVQQTDFDRLITDAGQKAIDGPGNTGRKDIRYFDDQGRELGGSAGAVYSVNTRVMPITPLPSVADSSGNAPAEASNSSLATVTVQVANNPTGQGLAFDQSAANDSTAPARNLWTGAYDASRDRTGVVTITTYSALVSKNR